MKNKSLYNYIMFIIFSVAIMLGALFFVAPQSVALAASAEKLLSKTDVETEALSKPSNACYYNGAYALIEDKSIIYYSPAGIRTTLAESLTSPKQIKFYDDNRIFYTNNGSIYLIDISAFPFLTKDITGSAFFDFNEDYLITVYSGTLSIISMDDVFNKTRIELDVPQNIKSTNPLPTDSKPICINDEGEIFYHATDNALYKFINDVYATSVKISNNNFNYLIANNEYVYGSNGNGVSRITISDHSETAIENPACDFDLGAIISTDGLDGLSFKGENLLITDFENKSVQEFSVANDELVFTGFAIASGKTAFNRIAKNSVDVEKFGNRVAVLDSNKLTLVNVTESFNTFNQENFENLFISSSPEAFALGNKSLIYYKDGKVNIHVLPTSAAIDSEVEGIVGAVKDLCFANDSFFVLTSNGADSYVYKVTGGIATEQLKYAGKIAELFSVDVFGNIYVADALKIYKNSEETTIPRADVTKLSTDLSGKLYAMRNGTLNKLEGEIWSDCGTGLTDSKSFALSVDSQEIYLTSSLNESIYVTLSAGNAAVSALNVPDNFLPKNANISGEIKVYTVNDGFNAYKTDYSESNFSFTEFAQKESEYVYAGETTFGDITLYALAGVNGVILADKNGVTEKPVSYLTPPETAYVTTGVCMYILPILSRNGDYCRTEGESLFRLEKGDEFTVLKAFTLCGTDFYEANYIDGETIYKGYVPVAFAVEVLNGESIAEKFTLEAVAKTTVYKDATLTEAISELNDGDKVKLFANENGVAEIAFQTENGFVKGYVSADKLKNEPSTAVRDILIILAVIASACGTSTYFILRKRNV